MDSFPPQTHFNLAPHALHQMALDQGCKQAKSGALIAYSGKKTGRSPQDKRVVQTPQSGANVWWGEASPNKPLTPESFEKNKALACSYICECPDVFVVDGFINWDIKVQLKVRIVCTQAYHALYMHNMMIRPSEEDLATFGEPDFTIYNAGGCTADPSIEGVSSTTCVAIHLDSGEMVILGTEYAGEMKKGIFSVMHYLMPLQGHLTLHSGCNVGSTDDAALFFGLSGTGKTTLSTDPLRPLIGDDEHCWTRDGLSNLEGGCYAKCINLCPDKEPEIFQAIRTGAVLENVVVDSQGVPDYDDTSITQNTRASYPVEHIENARIPCVGPHPKNIILLCCDAFGVLPPVAKLNKAQTMYHFISGYTAKVAGTEMGVTEPEATFSPCFGGAFLIWHPMVYASMLADKMEEHGTSVWFVNTGWTGGPCGTGHRMSLKHTRTIINAIHSGELAQADFNTMPVFEMSIPTAVQGVPGEVLQPWATWKDERLYHTALANLADLFKDNMRSYLGSPLVSSALSKEIEQGGPSTSNSFSKSSCAPAVSPAAQVAQIIHHT